MPVTTRRAEHLRAAEDRGWASADWPALGTTAQLVITEPSRLADAQAQVKRIVADIDHAASRFRLDSELSRLNAANGEWVDVSALLARALQVALEAARWTGGAVDPTVGAALVALGYDRTFSQLPDDGPRVTVGLRQVRGWRQVELDLQGRRARVPSGTVLDLGATAKGLAADLCASAVAEATGAGVLVSLGGDIALAGPVPEGGWPVTVADRSDLSLSADAAPESQLVVLRGGGLATSSVSSRRWRRGGCQLHHLLDPRTGRPASGRWRTVSVTAVTCALANAAATASVIVGDRAPDWLAAHALPARLVDVDGTVTYVGRWPRPIREEAG